jgi:hypothetical protein
MVAIVTADDLARRQRDDGSFGADGRAEARVVSTLLAARSLVEADLGDHPSVDPALDFLTRTAINGGCSIDGRRDGVLSCYTGMLARLMVGAGRVDAAAPLLDWIVAYQPVAFGDTTYHRRSGPIWGDYLRHRYGGCMADTTCLLGLVPAMSALADGRDAGIGLAVDAQLDAMSALLTDRRLMHGRSGTVIALSGRTKRDPSGIRWLLPAFPRDYVIDLIELVDLAARLGVPRGAMTEALELIESWKLPDGQWPLPATRRVVDAYRPELANRRRPSVITTRRVQRLGLGF